MAALEILLAHSDEWTKDIKNLIKLAVLFINSPTALVCFGRLFIPDNLILFKNISLTGLAFPVLQTIYFTNTLR